MKTDTVSISISGSPDCEECGLIVEHHMRRLGWATVSDSNRFVGKTIFTCSGTRMPQDVLMQRAHHDLGGNDHDPAHEGAQDVIRMLLMTP